MNEIEVRKEQFDAYLSTLAKSKLHTYNWTLWQAAWNACHNYLMSEVLTPEREVGEIQETQP